MGEVMQVGFGSRRGTCILVAGGHDFIAEPAQNAFQCQGKFRHRDGGAFLVDFEMVENRFSRLGHQMCFDLLHGVPEQFHGHIVSRAGNGFAVGCLKNQAVGM